MLLNLDSLSMHGRAIRVVIYVSVMGNTVQIRFAAEILFKIGQTLSYKLAKHLLYFYKCSVQNCSLNWTVWSLKFAWHK